ncbi:MAG: 16S rRNA processing protein RimM [Lachnospiraceae bacterium]|nr:16S rRNA processing protein RimM [Lachnospiraceae bacterium]
MEDLLRVGVVSSTHGLKGEVKVFPTTDDVKRFDYLKDVVLVSNKERLELEVSNVRYFKNMVIVKFKGIDDINDIEKYKGSELFVTRENAIPLEEDEYYIADLLDCKVYDEKAAFIGVLSEVLTSSANDVYVVKTSDESADIYKNEKELLIPYVDEYISSIDIENKKIIAKNTDRFLA